MVFCQWCGKEKEDTLTGICRFCHRFPTKFPTAQNRAQSVLIALGVSDQAKVAECDESVCREFLADLASTPAFVKFLKYMRS